MGATSEFLARISSQRALQKQTPAVGAEFGILGSFTHLAVASVKVRPLL